MSYAALAISFCLLGQAPGGSDDFAPIRVQPRRAAPPADFGEAPAEPAAAEAQAPADDWDIPPATEPAAPANRYKTQPAHQAQPPAADRYRSREPVATEQPSGHLETLGSQPPQKLRPPELIAEALENPKEAALVGTPMTLAQALANTTTRQQQLQITKAYWRLSTAQADYHWSLQQRDLLRDHTGPHTNHPGTLGARAAARADVRDAQLAVDKSQAELADLIGATGQRATPLASDRPHVGAYLFGDIQAPARMRLIQRTLPARRKAIDAHAEAIVAALDAVQATGEQFRTSGQGLATLLSSIDLLKQERRAFIGEVRSYNLDIAEYAITVAPAGVGGAELVSMLIRTSPAASTPTRAAAPGATPRRTLRPPSAVDQDGSDADAANRSAQRDDSWVDWAAHYPGDLNSAGDAGIYQGLLQVSSHPIRVQKLGNLLHWDRNLPNDAGDPLPLATCLATVPAANRLATIRAYWTVRQRAACLQLLIEQQEQLTSLRSMVIPQREETGLAEAGVRLQAVRRANRAAIIDAQIALANAQAALGDASGSVGGAARWPSTPPQAGRYVVSIRARRGYSRGAQWAERMALQYDKLQHRADAVIQCDAHRVEVIRQAQAQDVAAADDQMTSLDRVLWAIGRQNKQTLGFLADLTEYNMAIANYALATQPESMTAEELAGKLAIRRSTLRDS